MLAYSFFSPWQHAQVGPISLRQNEEKDGQQLRGFAVTRAPHRWRARRDMLRKELNDGSLNLYHRCNKPYRSCEGPEGL
jgi:hypothetical protein